MSVVEIEKSGEFLQKGSVKTAELTLGDTKVKVKTDATPAVLKQVRELVEHRYEDIADKLTKGLSTQQLTLLVAYNLAEELLEERNRLRHFKRQILERSERLLTRVESHLSNIENR